MELDAPGEDARPVLTSIERGYCRIVLNRPQRLNAITSDMLAELLTALERCQANEAVRAILITGSGRAFCVGQDLNARDPRKTQWPPNLEKIQREQFHPVVRTLRNIGKPVVIAVNGAAAGAGSSLALAGDIVVAARSAHFIQSFSKIGLSVDASGGWHLTRILGGAKARGWLMTAEPMSATQAAEAGLIWKCVDDAALLPEAEALTTRLASGPTRAFAAIKAAVAVAEAEASFESYLGEEARLQGEMSGSEDYREGVLAFLEKRVADFKGK